MDQMSLRLLATNIAMQQAMNDYEQDLMQARNYWLFQASMATLHGGKIPDEIPSVEEPEVEELLSAAEASLAEINDINPMVDVPPASTDASRESNLEPDVGNAPVDDPPESSEIDTATAAMEDLEDPNLEPEETIQPASEPEETKMAPAKENPEVEVQSKVTAEQDQTEDQEPTNTTPKSFDELPDPRFKGISGILGNLRLVRKPTNQNT